MLEQLKGQRYIILRDVNWRYSIHNNYFISAALIFFNQTGLKVHLKPSVN